MIIPILLYCLGFGVLISMAAWSAEGVWRTRKHFSPLPMTRSDEEPAAMDSGRFAFSNDDLQLPTRCRPSLRVSPAPASDLHDPRAGTFLNGSRLDHALRREILLKLERRFVNGQS